MRRYILVDTGPSLVACIVVGLMLFAFIGPIMAWVIGIALVFMFLRNFANPAMWRGIGTMLCGCILYYLVIGMWR